MNRKDKIIPKLSILTKEDVAKITGGQCICEPSDALLGYTPYENDIHTKKSCSSRCCFTGARYLAYRWSGEFNMCFMEPIE